MTITDSIMGRPYEVVSINRKDYIMRRLEALGINEGTKIVVLNRKRNGTAIIKVRGTRWAIGKEIADTIEIIDREEVTKDENN